MDSKSVIVLKNAGYVLQEKLHTGAMGHVVYKGRHVTEKDVAVKVLLLDKLGKSFEQKYVNGEMATLIQIRHDHVIALHDIIRCSAKIFVCMELATGGDISQYMVKNGPINEPLTCYWFNQCAQAVAFMHDKHHMAHKDIQCDNVMLHNNKVKLTGMGKVEISEGKLVGYAPYFSPQMLLRKGYNLLRADDYAMGILFFAMLNNKYPFHWDDEKVQLTQQSDKKFLATHYIKRFPADLIDLQEKLLVVDESKRITMAQVLKHPWIIRKGK